MLKQVPFSEVEHKIWGSLGNIAGWFSSLDPTHPSDRQDITNAIHQLQDVLGRRALRREYPGSFASYRKVPGGWTLENKESKDDKTND